MEPKSLVDNNQPDRGFGQCGGVIGALKTSPNCPWSGLVGLPAAGTSWRGGAKWGGGWRRGELIALKVNLI